jgi:hypothetical protein
MPWIVVENLLPVIIVAAASYSVWQIAKGFDG